MGTRRSTLADRARDALIGLIVGENKAGGEVIQCQLKKMQAELIGPDTTPVVRLAAERVLAIWLQVQLLDIRVTDQHASLDHLNFYSRQQDQAESAVRSGSQDVRDNCSGCLWRQRRHPRRNNGRRGAMPTVNAMRQMAARMATPRTA